MLVTAVDVVVLIAFLGVLKHYDNRRSRRGFPIPPGPRGLPLIRNTSDIPKSRSWVVYKEWARKYGDVQQHARAEVDAATRRERLPNYDDRAGMPYVHAVVKEVLRWHTVLVLGTYCTHAALENDVYEGYSIPRGAFVLSVLLSAPAVTATFDFGQRLCPGRHPVDSTLYLVIVTFEVRRTPPTPAEAAFTDAFVSHPEKFACEIVPRGDVPTGARPDRAQEARVYLYTPEPRSLMSCAISCNAP
ncbi:cytochrome P450 [Auriscalpium vulgare]|uniref:Cytochrome P450 n=1 Tax=Auriscalpium vulgare TaxID=40419 RepID=A0ACB8RIR2_9AGAM|nr:cytochrome P450 [Auriscalpium vulgare]